MEMMLIVLSVIGIVGILWSYIDLQKYIEKHEDKDIDKIFYNMVKHKTTILCGCLIFLAIVQVILVHLRYHPL